MKTAARRLGLPGCFALGTLLLPALSGCYLAKQGAYILRYQLASRPVSRLLARDRLSPGEREFLLRVREIRRFAVEEIGLKANRNYTRYVRVNRSYLVDVVSASARDRFEPYLWRFPFFGAFPYKGFFERRDAEREAEALRRRDLDVFIRTADAFSTLGFFSDPLYSYMAGDSPYELANLIIHEQTHATVFIRNQVNFDEEMATFVGREGALWFVRRTRGAGSEYYRKLLLYLQDEDTFYRLIGELHDRLQAAYAGPASREEKLREKQRLLEEFRAQIDSDPGRWFRTDSFRGVFGRLPLNNASILAFMEYIGDLSLFYRLYDRMGGDLRRTVEFLKGIPRQGGDPRAPIRKLLGETGATLKAPGPSPGSDPPGRTRS